LGKVLVRLAIFGEGVKDFFVFLVIFWKKEGIPFLELGDGL